MAYTNTIPLHMAVEMIEGARKASWNTGGTTNRLVALDGQILERVLQGYNGEYRIESTGKYYISLPSAQKAAEDLHNVRTGLQEDFNRNFQHD